MATAEVSARHRYRRAAESAGQEEDDSDAEDAPPGLRRADGLESQIIHSGHFMVSAPHCEHPPKKGYDFDTVNKQTCQTYHFGKASTSHFSIDASLTKLFECMTLAYSGKLVSPKWKNFKGLKLLWRDKIRLNNAIWRAWYMQYVERRENPVCHFVTPLDGSMVSDVNRTGEGVGTEGKCWKRRIEIVIREYHKWRTYFKKRLQKHKDDDLSSLLKGKEEQLSLFGEVSPDMLRFSFYQDEEAVARRAPRRHMDTPAPMEMDTLFDMDVLMSEFSDTLFSTLASHQPMAWPNPREIAHAGNADMIQPGLIPLQPNLDFMDSFDPLQDLFHSLRQPVFPSVSPTASSVTLLSGSGSHAQAQLMSSMQLSDNNLSPAAPSPLGSQESRVGPGDDGAYPQSYMPLFPGQVAAGDGALAPATSGQLSRDHLAPCLPGQDMASAAALDAASGLDESGAPSVITHTASSAVAPGNVATTTSAGGGCSSAAAQHPQTFAQPRSFQSSSANKARPVQRIAPANALPPPHLVFTAPFTGHTNAVIVTPTNLKTDVVPNAGMLIASSHQGGAPGFHVVSQAQKSLQAIVPKQKSFTSSRRNQKASSSIVSSQPGPGPAPGTSCLLDQLPSPQSLISSSTALVKNEHNQGRRSTHISAEQKRRSNINIGFKTLSSLVPALKSQSNISNAVTLQKTVEHIGKLQQERQQMQEEVKRLREEIEQLNSSISLCQEQLPATGVPVRRNQLSHMHEKFNEYVKSRTLHDWKFWIFSIIIKPLFESFNGMVSTTSRAELCQTTLQWLDRHCSLPALRPMVLSTLCQLSTRTSILSDPSLLPEEAMQAAACTDM